MAQEIKKKLRYYNDLQPSKPEKLSNKHAESVHSSLLKVNIKELPRKDGVISKTDTVKPEMAQAGPVLSNQVEAK